MDDCESDHDSEMLISVRQPSGRSLWCWKYVIASTYDGFSVRTPCESCNVRVLEIVKEESARLFGTSWPVHVIPSVLASGQIEYPAIRITAFFKSMPIDADMHLSSLVMVWFQDNQKQIPDDIARAKLSCVDWERLALDYET